MTLSTHDESSILVTCENLSPYEESRREASFIVGSKQQSEACNEHAGQRARERCYMSGGAGEAVGHAREASATDRPELRKLE